MLTDDANFDILADDDNTIDDDMDIDNNIDADAVYMHGRDGLLDPDDRRKGPSNRSHWVLSLAHGTGCAHTCSYC